MLWAERKTTVSGEDRANTPKSINDENPKKVQSAPTQSQYLAGWAEGEGTASLQVPALPGDVFLSMHPDFSVLISEKPSSYTLRGTCLHN